MPKSHLPTSFALKAIETRWNGYRFRSRTEARWAVLLTNLGIRYEYEPEGYKLPSGKRYLPDFYLPDLKCFIEIKGADGADIEKVCEFSLAVSPKWVLVAFGLGTANVCPLHYLHGKDQLKPANFVYCACCGRVGIEAKHRLFPLLPCNCREAGHRDAISAAFEEARSARFEHGESPEVP